MTKTDNSAFLLTPVSSFCSPSGEDHFNDLSDALNYAASKSARRPPLVSDVVRSGQADDNIIVDLESEEPESDEFIQMKSQGVLFPPTPEESGLAEGANGKGFFNSETSKLALRRPISRMRMLKKGSEGGTLSNL